MDVLSTPAPGALPRLGQSLRVSQIVVILRRSSAVILICALAGTLAAYVFAKSNPARYTAAAAIAIESQTFAIPELQGAVSNERLTDPMPLIRTEVQAIMSRGLVQSVVAKLRLDRLPEFNPALRPATFFGALQGRLQQFVALPGAAPQDRRDDSVIDAAFRALVVSQDNRSLVIGVAFTSEDPVLDAQFVNTLVDSYVASRTQRSAGANRNANAEILQRVGDVRARLTKLQQQMRDLRTKDEVVGLRAGSIGQQQVEDLASAAARASLERAELEAQWKRAQMLTQHGLSSELTDVLSSTTITRLREQESEASRRLADLQSLHGPKHPSTLSAQAELAAARGQVDSEVHRIVSALAGQLTTARAHEADAQRQLQAARAASVTSENAQAQLNDLQEELNAQRALYQSLLQGAQKTMAQATSSTPALDVRILSTAVPPAKPSSPKPKLAAAAGGVSGLILGLLLAFVRARASDMIITADDVTDAIGLPVAAVITGRRGGHRLMAGVRADPSGPPADKLRLLRARVRAASAPSGSQNVLFLCADEDASAADVAAAFAYVLGGDGERIVLLEGNLRQPCLGRLLGVHRGGLRSVLSGAESWRDMMLSDAAGRVDFLVAESEADASPMSVGGAHLQNILMDLQDTYHLTILVGPSAISADALALAREVPVTVLIIRAGRTLEIRRQGGGLAHRVCIFHTAGAACHSRSVG